MQAVNTSELFEAALSSAVNLGQPDPTSGLTVTGCEEVYTTGDAAPIDPSIFVRYHPFAPTTLCYVPTSVDANLSCSAPAPASMFRLCFCAG